MTSGRFSNLRSLWIYRLPTKVLKCRKQFTRDSWSKRLGRRLTALGFLHQTSCFLIKMIRKIEIQISKSSFQDKLSWMATVSRERPFYRNPFVLLMLAFYYHWGRKRSMPLPAENEHPTDHDRNIQSTASNLQGYPERERWHPYPSVTLSNRCLGSRLIQKCSSNLEMNDDRRFIRKTTVAATFSGFYQSIVSPFEKIINWLRFLSRAIPRVIGLSGNILESTRQYLQSNTPPTKSLAESATCAVDV